MKALTIFFLILLSLEGWGRLPALDGKLRENHFPKNGQCVLIYYDQAPLKNYQLGKIYSIYLQNLLGHFPEFTQIISPIERYRSGEIEKCRSTIYIGSYFENQIPSSFYIDFEKTKKNVAWLGYSIWKFGDERLEKMFGHRYAGLTTLDLEKLNSEGLPSFFKFIEYKGEKFEKFAKWVDRPEGKVFAAPFEQVILKKSEDALSSSFEIKAQSRHDRTGEVIPYIIRSKNKFYVADVPFSYAHESDRYLVFADLLFDILGTQPRHREKLAIMRIEDVHPKLPLRNLMLLQDVFKEEKVPLHIALIPLFFDPLYRYDRGPTESFLPMTSVPQFMNWLKGVQQDKGVIIWHGVTHQYSTKQNPHSGYTSDDFEFWNAVQNTSLAEDSVQYVLDRLDLGIDYLKKAQIYPKIWLTPHYQASALDYHIFADVFEWNIGRAIYFQEKHTSLDRAAENLKAIKYSSKNPDSKNLRIMHFKNFKVDSTGEWFGQLYPFEIYGDVYGQRMFPEILGNPQPFTSDHVWYPRSIDQILEDARRNLVLRDTWAASFFHPYLLTDITNGGVGNYAGDVEQLRTLIRGIKNLGYKFVNLEEFSEATQKVKNVKRLEIKLDNSVEIKK